ncbi:MAG TPA: septal ring lytic transglycosylase RlpA family protein [Solirubrobacteraceae bacterium]|jgi:rare lipoprotein A (peptidoglycan hydrolase)|nr:septal ring lytic transglycosylase RlpA family protein [Solirubrobacteraceae bacterium]
MRLNFKTPALLLAPIAALALPAAALGASSGGAAAPSPAASSPTTTPAAKVHTTGIATWFGPGFYGQKTACGQTLTPGVVGVANRTLPCGTLIKVTYAGHALIVPVLDRGPYSHIGADWDLTGGAATALGITETVRIGTHVVGSTPNTPTLGLPPAEASSPLAGGALAG